MTNKQASAFGIIIYFQAMIMWTHDIHAVIVISAFILAFTLVLSGFIGTQKSDK